MIDHPVEPRNQIGLPAAAQAALKDGELDPLTVSLHQLEHPPPPLGVADVVDDDVEMLHGITAS